MKAVMPICLSCEFYQGHVAADYFCEAFPDGIPDEVLFVKFYHNKKHPDQKNDILFKRVDPRR